MACAIAEMHEQLFHYSLSDVSNSGKPGIHAFKKCPDRPLEQTTNLLQRILQQPLLKCWKALARFYRVDVDANVPRSRFHLL